MIERFQGKEGRRRLVAALAEHRLLAGIEGLPERVADVGQLRPIAKGETFIQQGSADTEVYFIIAGAADIVVNGKLVAIRHTGDHVGEMAAIEPTQLRSATVTARESGVLLWLSEAIFIALANAYPNVWRRLAATLSRRLVQRNALIAQPRTQVRVFVMSSVEALPVT